MVEGRAADPTWVLPPCLALPLAAGEVEDEGAEFLEDEEAEDGS